MDTSLAVDWSQEAIRLALQMGGPLLAVALFAGLVVGIGQTLTQLHEPVIGLVPRLVIVIGSFLVLLPWLIGRWVSFTTSLFDSLPTLLTGP